MSTDRDSKRLDWWETSVGLKTAAGELPKWRDTDDFRLAAVALLEYAYATARIQFDYDWFMNECSKLFPAVDVGGWTHTETTDQVALVNILMILAQERKKRLEFCRDNGLTEEELHQKWSGSPPEPE